MSRIVLTKEQRAAIDQAKADGKRRITIQLTESQRAVERQIDAEVEAEKDKIIAMGRAHLRRRKSRAAAIADQIRQARENSGMSLTDVAAATGMTRQAIMRLENGENTNPKLNTINRIAKAFGKTLEITLQDAP